jgi:transposase-like protein
MANAMLDARQEDGTYRRVELITGQRRRRRWTAEEKARIVAESFEEGANISEVARRHGVVRGLLTVWRRQVSKAVAVKAPAAERGLRGGCRTRGRARERIVDRVPYVQALEEPKRDPKRLWRTKLDDRPASRPQTGPQKS